MWDHSIILRSLLEVKKVGLHILGDAHLALRFHLLPTGLNCFDHRSHHRLRVVGRCLRDWPTTFTVFRMAGATLLQAKPQLLVGRQDHPTFSHRHLVVAKSIGTSIKATPVGCSVVLVHQVEEFPNCMGLPSSCRRCWPFPCKILSPLKYGLTCISHF